MTKARRGFPFWPPVGVANRVLNILVAQIGLQPASIVSRIRQRIAATMAQHVRVDREGHFGPSKTRPRPLPCRDRGARQRPQRGRRSGNFFPICCAGRFEGFSLERLLGFVRALGSDVEIKVKRRRDDEHGEGRLSLMTT